MTLRFKLPPGGDVPPVTAARRIGLSLDEFNSKLPGLIAEGFPPPRRTTGNFDLDAVDAWRRWDSQRSCPHLFSPPLTPAAAPRDVKSVVAERLARMRGG